MEGEATVQALDEYTDKTMSEILEDDSEMVKIEQEIKEVTEG